MKKTLFFLLLTLCACQTKAQFIINPYRYSVAGISTTGLRLYWDVSKSASYPGSGTTITDLSGNGHNGTLVNGVSYSSSSGGYLSFDGTDDYVTNTSYGVHGLSNCTIHVWKKHAGAFTGTIFSSGTTTVGSVYLETRSYNFYADGGFWSISTNSGGGYDTWKLFTFVYQSGSQKIYENGVLQTATESQPGALDTYYSGTQTRLGSSNNNDNFSAVDVGLLAIYNTTMTGAEITTFFNTTKTRFGY